MNPEHAPERPGKLPWHAPDFEEADVSEVTEAGGPPSPIYDAGSYS